jgi:hypothetical protein
MKAITDYKKNSNNCCNVLIYFNILNNFEHYNIFTFYLFMFLKVSVKLKTA